ncbi:MAG: hypothetical protein ACFE9Q_00880 [Candidatus Hodarchaeota archaeon]
MKKISEKQDDTEKKLSTEIKITDEEMRRNYDKFLGITFFGFELIIINLIYLVLVYITISVSTVYYITFFLLIPLGFAIGAYGLYGIYSRKRKPEKYSKEIKITDEEMRRNYNKFLVISFFGFVPIIINLTISPIQLILFKLIVFILLMSLGIALGAYGSYGLYLHKQKPEKYREIIEKKLERKISLRLRKKMGRKKISIGLSGFGGFLNIIIGLLSLFGIGLFGMGGSPSSRIFFGITFLPSGILAFVGAFIEFKSLIIGGFLCLLTGILTIVLPLIVNYNYFFTMIAYIFLIIPTLLIIVGGILGILEQKSMKSEKI